MATRITGLATGMDIDSYVKAEMSVYQTKVDNKQKDKEILEVKRDMYRDVITKGTDIWDKYFDRIKEGSLLKSSTYTTTSFTSSDENSVTAQGVSGKAIRDNYSVAVTKLAKAPKVLLKSDLLEEMKLNNKKEITFKMGTETAVIDVSPIYDSTQDDDETKLSKLQDALNIKLSSLNLRAVYSEIAGGVIVESKDTGEKSEFIMEGTGRTELDKKHSGEDAEYTITTSSGYKTGKSSSNKVVLDGIEFTFNAVTQAGQEVKLTCKNDADKLADKLITFVNDYNKFIEELNTYYNDKHDRSYRPLTAEQKKEMSEDEIKLWNEKVKKGQLHRDSDISTIITNMKTAMTTLVSGTNLTLDSMGITSTEDYRGNKNGTFIVDKKKLVSALEENPEESMKFFISTTSEKDDAVKAYNEKGIFNRMYDIFYNNFKSSTSSLIIKKAGIQGSDSNAALTLEIDKYASKLTEMKRDLSTREQKLYSKYARLEKVMNNYNNQLAKIQSMFQS